MWQSLSFGPNYKAAYCLSVCPAGEDVIGPYLADKKAHLRENVRPLLFQPGKSGGLNATFHFTFTGSEQRQATIVIRDKKLTLEEGHVGQPNLHITADSQTWIGFLKQEQSVV